MGRAAWAGRAWPRHGPRRPGRIDTAALAKALGVDEAKITDALQQVRDDHAGRDAFVSSLAKALGAKESDVQSVLDNVRGQDGDRDHHGPGARVARTRSLPHSPRS